MAAKCFSFQSKTCPGERDSSLQNALDYVQYVEKYCTITPMQIE